MGVFVDRYECDIPPKNEKPAALILPAASEGQDPYRTISMEILHSSPGQICTEQLVRIRLKVLKNNSVTVNKNLNYKSHNIKKHDGKRTQLMRHLLSKDISNYKLQHSLSTWAIHIDYPES